MSVGTNITIRTLLQWMVTVLPSGRWLGVCDALGVTAEGSDETELRGLIEETQYTLFLDLLEDGELDQFLRERGWNTGAPIPTRMPDDGVQFEVPFKLVRSPIHGSPSAANQ